MPMCHCRICGQELEKIIVFENMPASAQCLPSKDDLERDKGGDLELAVCFGCGVIQHTGEPVSYYKEVIRATAYSDEMKAFRQGQFRELAATYNLHGKKALEVGCGRGEYLSLLREAGLDAYGTEFGKENWSCCVESGFEAYRAFLGDDDAPSLLPRAPFGVFFSFNFFEHIPCLPKTLKAIRDNLSDGALGLVEVPNFDMILSNNMYTEFIRDHLFYFTERTLVTTLEMNGFDVVYCKSIWHDYILSCLVRKRSAPDFGAFNSYRAALNENIRRFAEKHPGRGLAVWGAGHQALAVLSMCDDDLVSRFECVIDSAPFKQRKYTPATHLPILSPERLKEGDIRAVLIMAAAYSDEVAEYVGKNHEAVDAAILRNNTVVYPPRAKGYCA